MKSIFNKNIKKYYIIILLFIIGAILFLTNNIKNLLLIIEPLTNSLSSNSFRYLKNRADEHKANNVYVNNNDIPKHYTSEQEKLQAIGGLNVATENVNNFKEILTSIKNSLEYNTETFSNNNRNYVDPNINNPCSACNHGGTTGGASIVDQTCMINCNLNGANGIA